jgi:hypothetical protein
MSWPISGVARSQIRDLKEVKEEARGAAASAIQMTCLAPGQAVRAAEQQACLPSQHTQMGGSS